MEFGIDKKELTPTLLQTQVSKFEPWWFEAQHLFVT